VRVRPAFVFQELLFHGNEHQEAAHQVGNLPEIYAKIVEDTGLTRKDVAAVFDSLNGQIKKNLGGRGAPGMFTVPGLLKMRVVKKPARKARKGVPNPFKPGELMDVAAKPASKVVKVSPLKGLKDMV